MRKILVVMASLVILAGMAVADPVAIGPGVTTGSWDQQWQETGVPGGVDFMQLVMTTPGASLFEIPAFNFSNGGWSSSLLLGGRVLNLSGPFDTNILFNTRFTSDIGTPFAFDFFGFANGHLVDPAHVAWNGQSWTITGIPEGSPVPEPASLTLMGTGVIGLAGFIRRKLAR